MGELKCFYCGREFTDDKQYSHSLAIERYIPALTLRAAEYVLVKRLSCLKVGLSVRIPPALSNRRSR
jgi:hypothetical protein